MSKNLHNFRWESFTDVESDISQFEVCLGTAQAECDEVDYKSVGLDTVYDFNELKLRHDETYYVTVKATNNAGLSTQATSDEIKIDVTPPRPVKMMSGSSLDLEEVCSPASAGSCNTTTSGKLKLSVFILFFCGFFIHFCQATFA
jgi:hypothetical protein